MDVWGKATIFVLSRSHTYPIAPDLVFETHWTAGSRDGSACRPVVATSGAFGAALTGKCPEGGGI